MVSNIVINEDGHLVIVSEKFYVMLFDFDKELLKIENNDALAGIIYSTMKDFIEYNKEKCIDRIKEYLRNNDILTGSNK